MSEQPGIGGRKRDFAVRTELLRGSASIPIDARTLAEFLKFNPRVAAESRDDAKCKAFLGELGILELFTKSAEPKLAVLTFRYHLTHWIVGLRWSGYSETDENGYRVFCLPKHQFPEDGVKDFVRYVMESYGGYGQEHGVIELPPNWRKQN